MSTPCLKRLDANCFRARPAWAKQAFAYRLVNLLTPKPLTKRLPKGLRTALLAPGVMMPPGVELPPGTVIAPGAEIPAGWTTGDPLPPGAIPPGAIPPGAEATGVTPPGYVAPWEPGPTGTAARGAAPAVVYWFNEPFDDLTTYSWSDISYSGGSAAIVSANLRLHSTSGGAYSAIQRTHGVTWPTNWTLELSLNHQAGSGVARVEIRTGTYRVRIFWTPPTTVNVLPSSGTCQATVADYTGSATLWTLEVTGNLGTLKMNGTPVISSCNMFASSSSPGRMTVAGYDALTCLFDYLRVIED